MKKVRLLKFLFLWLAAGILISGCSDDEDPIPTVVGYWELRTIEIRNSANSGLLNPTVFFATFGSGEDEIDVPVISVQLELLEDNNEFVEYFNYLNGLTDATDGNWELSDDQSTLTLEYPSSDSEYEITFDFNEMILTEEANNGATIIYRYTKEF